MTLDLNFYDIVLGLAFLAAMAKAMFARDAFVASLFYISGGMGLALIWVRIGAPDVALAEGAIGSGLTGALLLGALRRFQDPEKVAARRAIRGLPTLFAPLAVGLVLMLGLALFNLPEPHTQVAGLIAENLPNSGTTHPITAVLLNFRSFDTWLELGVLLLAALIAARISGSGEAQPLPEEASTELKNLARGMLPILVTVGGILLWLGARSPGGAFQGGAVLAAAGIFLQLAGMNSLLTRMSLRLKLLVVGGFATFMICGVIFQITGGHFLEYPELWASSWILVIELFATFSIAAILNLLFFSAIGERKVEL